MALLVPKHIPSNSGPEVVREYTHWQGRLQFRVANLQLVLEDLWELQLISRQIWRKGVFWRLQ